MQADISNSNHAHLVFMQQCEELALVAKERGESPVGSIVVLNGEMIGEGIEAVKVNNDITFHAEIEAIRRASGFLGHRNLAGCILYTTHEPCIMCSYVIRQTRISTVVMKNLTGDTGGYSSKLPVLLDTNVEKWGEPPVTIVL